MSGRLAWSFARVEPLPALAGGFSDIGGRVHVGPVKVGVFHPDIIGILAAPILEQTPMTVIDTTPPTPPAGSASAWSPGSNDQTAFGWTPTVKKHVTCPHCWKRFHIGDIAWVARHEKLRGDPLAGPDAMRRFVPTRFNLAGEAIDAAGQPCQQLACPACHLPIARGLLEARQLYLSLIGVPGSGKSYLTAAMSWHLRRVLPEKFGVGFSDVDPAGNQALIDHEATLFLADDPERPVSIEKTQMQGAHYDPIQMGEQTVLLARPFQFMLTDQRGRPAADADPNTAPVAPPLPRVLNLYDNAGEHFLPGADTTLTPGTQHLARANLLMFLFDPLQEPRVRAALGQSADDPQVKRPHHAARQDTVLNEMGQRVRRYAGLSASAQLEQPLLVLVGKADAWAEHAGLDWGTDDEPVVRQADGTVAVDIGLIEKTSDTTRRWLESHAPEFVALAEGLHRTVRYLPVSALGGPPELSADGSLLLVRPGHLRSRWVTAPVLYALSKWSSGVLPAAS